MRRRKFLSTACAAAAATLVPTRRTRAAGHTFRAGEAAFELDGKPIVLRSGSMHYPRVPRPYWRDRMRKLRALGLNTVCTYVFWNAHEPRPGVFDFSGNLDLAAYLETAQEEGLWVLLRPGPYICTEWDFGGFPSWLLAPPAMQVRSTDPRFLAAARRYLDRVGREVGHLQITRGGPILMVQVENEYGSYGSDHTYTNAIREAIRHAGFDVQLYTADGPDAKLLAGGTLPDLPCAANFGDGDDPAQAFATVAKFRPSGPRMCGEYWDGWFDHWGEQHHTTPPQHSARGLDWMLSNGISCNLYMAHGGTSFGFMAGANFGRRYQPTVTSYDYDSPIDEAGRPTPKFDALRTVIEKHLPPGELLPALPPPLPTITLPKFDLTEFAPLSQLLGAPIRAERPLPMEALGQNYGLVWYRCPLPPARGGTLRPVELRDFGRAYQNGQQLAEFDRSRDLAPSAQVTLASGVPLDIVVENMGRINFGPHLQDNQQGITERVLIGEDEITGWEMVPLPLDNVAQLRFSPAAPATAAPGFWRGRFSLDTVGDFFLPTAGWGKGYVWVNGHNLGRFWDRGPQLQFYVPGCWLRPGTNEIIVFDWDARAGQTVPVPPGPIAG